MDQTITYISMGIISLVFGLSLYKARQPIELGKSWHIPWNGILFLCFMFMLLLIRHQFTLSGVELPSR